MAETAELVVVPRTSQELVRENFMPVFDTEAAVARQKAMSEFIGKILRESTTDEPGDYGVIPGAGKQKVLLKPGAEKLCSFFGLSPHFEAEHIVEDWVGLPEHGKEPLFYYRFKCQLYRGDRFMVEAIGSCNSREKKYRYRAAQRLCPQCGNPAIIVGKPEYGGGFVCYQKKGGCGAKFAENDVAITGQQVGQVINPDVADLMNTIQKIAQKRALVAAVLIGTNASDSFTQDLEDSDGDEPPSRGPQPQTNSAGRAGTAHHPAEPAVYRGGNSASAPVSDPQLAALLARCRTLKDFGDVCGELLDIIGEEYGPEARTKVWKDAVAHAGTAQGQPPKKEDWIKVLKFIHDAAATIQPQMEMPHAS